jgi:hypothetical protein
MKEVSSEEFTANLGNGVEVLGWVWKRNKIEIGPKLIIQYSLKRSQNVKASVHQTRTLFEYVGPQGVIQETLWTALHRGTVLTQFKNFHVYNLRESAFKQRWQSCIWCAKNGPAFGERMEGLLETYTCNYNS